MTTSQPTNAAAIDEDRARRYQEALALIRSWAAEASEYDEEVWRALEPELADATMRCQEDKP